jgi:hypothetical protein
VGEDATRAGGPDRGQDAGTTLVTVAEAAQQLGISKEAVRKRITRGTLRSDKAPDGTVRVYAPATRDAAQTQSASDELISEMRERIASLERQLEQERQANSEHRRLLAAALERIPPQIEASSETRESPETAQEEPDRAEPRPDAGGASEAEGAQRPWWRKMFGA